MDISRRWFLSPAAAAMAAAAAGSRAEAQLIYQRSEWNIKDFEKLVASPARAKQVYDVSAVGGGRFLNNVKNSLNGLHYGFGIADGQIQIVAALHGPANALNFDDSLWEKYRLGETFDILDPSTNKPATRNPFFQSTRKNASVEFNDERSSLQDTSIEALQSRGVRFLSCHTAMEEQARLIIRKWNLNQQPEDVVKEMLSHVHPGVLVVASMVAAIALLQCDGHYSYIYI